MNLLQAAAIAFDRVFVRLTIIGQLKNRKFNATMILTIWSMFFFLSLYAFVDRWIYPVDALYLELWPYRSDNFRSPRSTSFALGMIFFISSFIVAHHTARRCANLIRQDALTSKKFILFFIIFVGGGVGSVAVLSEFHFGPLLVIPAHLILFYLLARRSPHGVNGNHGDR